MSAAELQPEPDLSKLDLERWRAELLDPDSWGKILSECGQTMRVAVALTDVNGRVLGICHNPQPVWKLAHNKAATDTACAFCITPSLPCTSVTDALASGVTVYAQDPRA